MALRARFLALQSLLAATQALWRPAPFHERRPGWTRRRPALAEAVLALDEAALESLAAAPAATAAWLCRWLPEAAEMRALCGVDPLPVRGLPPRADRFDDSIPLRKRQQIEAFGAVAPACAAPLLEWCAGKGHLGRRLALADRVAVTSLDIDPVLCREAERLARASGADQRARCVDAMSAVALELVRGREVVALHACGELHRTLVREAGHTGAKGYRIAPCCYDRGADAGYRPLSSDAQLPLERGDLRLAVTETVTAPAGVRRQLQRDQVFKLGFKAMAEALGLPLRPSFRPVPAAWLGAGFESFCHALAAREGLELPARLDWAHWQAAGEARRAEVRRLELVRHVFRRPLEMWLVLDQALALQAAGFETRLGSFCARESTPRNLMLVARA